MSLSEEGIVARDAMVFAEAARRHIPAVMVLGGGYSKNAWRAQCRSISNLIQLRCSDGPTATNSAPESGQ